MNVNRQDDTLIFNMGNMLLFDSSFVCLTTGKLTKEQEPTALGGKPMRICVNFCVKIELVFDKRGILKFYNR